MTFHKASVNLVGFETLKKKDRKIKQTISLANERILKAFQLFPLFFLLAFLAYFLVKMGFEWGLTAFNDPKEGPWKVQLLAGLTDVFFGLFLIFAYGFSLQALEYKAISLKEFLSERLMPFISEGLFALAHILIGVILLILPGIVLYVLYTFLPYIIFFNKDYLEGELNPLKESRKMVGRHFLKILFLVLITGLISLCFELLPKAFGFVFWWQEIFFSAIAFYFSGFTFMLFYTLYVKYQEEK